MRYKAVVYGVGRLVRGVIAALALFALATVVTSEPACAKTRQYDLSPAPHWVQPLAPDTQGKLPPNAKDGGTAYLLADRQIRIQHGWSEYDRFVTQAVNSAGVDDASQVTIDFDPALDHLIVHAVTVRRGAQVIDELREGRISPL